MTDNDNALVERLREAQCPDNMGCNPLAKYCQCVPMDEAAERIEAQAAEIERISSQRDAYLDGYKKAFAEVVKLHDALERIEVATRNEVRAGNKGYVSRYGINGIARAALEQSK